MQLSVVIPTYNRNQSLFRLIYKLEAQTKVIIQIIVVDQNKADFFSNTELQYLQKHTYVKQTVPNVSAARNLGFEYASADYILFVDDDLVPNEDFCFKIVELFSNNKEVKAFAPLVYGYEDKEQLKNKFQKQYIGALPTNNNIHLLPETISACLVFEKSHFIKTGGFDPILFDFAKSTEDQELFKRMQQRGLDFYHTLDVEIFHDDKTTGGCDLRSEDYWTSRYKFMKGWAYRYMMHKNKPGSLTIKDYFKMVRSAFFNKEGLKNGFGYCKKQCNTLFKAVKEASLFIKQLENKEGISNVNHFLQKTKYV
jgi:GT2 family glycosyltransferase